MYALRTAVRRAPCLPRAPYGARLRLHGVRHYGIVTDIPISSGKTKVWKDIDSAVGDVKSGDILLSGGQ